MKAKDDARLDDDFIKYCNQLGIIDRPRLIKSKKEMHIIQTEAGQKKDAGGWGSCHWKLGVVFVNCGKRLHNPSKDYKGWNNPKREQVKHKSKYIDFRNTLVHELVHWRFPKLRHGKKFEERIYEVLRGKKFEIIYGQPSTQQVFIQAPDRPNETELEYIDLIIKTYPDVVRERLNKMESTKK